MIKIGCVTASHSTQPFPLKRVIFLAVGPVGPERN